MNKHRYKINFGFSKQLNKLVINNAKKALFLDFTEVYLIKISGNKENLQIHCSDQIYIVDILFKEELILYKYLVQHNFLQVKPFHLVNLNLCDEVVYAENYKAITFKNSRLVIINPNLKMITKIQGINIFCGIKKQSHSKSELYIKKPDTKYYYSIPG